MANATTFLKPSTMVTPLQFSDSGRIDFRFLRYSTDVYHTLWCYIVDKNGEHIKDEQLHDIRILLANEDNINWDVPSSFPNYKFSLPETAAELFDFSTPDNCYVDFAIFTYSSSTYSGSSIIGTEWFSDYSEIVKVQPSNKMYPQIRLIITDETKAYKNTGGKYFYLDNDASQIDLSSNGNIKVKINYYSGHEPEPGAVSQDFCQINGQQAPAVFTNNGLNYNRNTAISGTSIIDTESKTNFRISVTDEQGLSSEYTTSITWANTIPATKFNDLKELSEDDLRYDYRLGTPVPTSLYLDPDWTATEYTTAPVPDDWEYYADIGDNGTGLINQRDILNDQKRQLNLQLFRKYYRYIQEGTWLDDSYIDDNLYYLDANKILNQSSYPKATYTIDVVDINGIKKYAAYEFTLGQRTYVEDPDMFGYVYNTVAGGEVKTPFRKEVIISERSRNLDDPSKSTIKVQTYKNQWEDIFSSLTATTQSLQYASGGYARAANAVNPNGSINVHSLEQTFQQGDFALSGSATQSITWDGSYGIEIADMSNSLIKLRIASNGLAITTDGGATWNNAITGNGINTNYLLAGQIDASKINIISKEGDYAFNWNEKGLNAVLPLQEGDNPDDAGNSYVRFNDLGIYGTMEGADIDTWESTHGSASIAERIAYIKEHSTFFLGWEGLTLREIDGNVINLNPNVGLEIFNNNTYEPPATSPWLWDNTKLNGTNFNKDPNGITYQVGDKIPVITLGEFYNGSDSQYGLLMRDSNGTPTLYTDENGNLTMTGNITANNGFLKRLYLEKVNRTSYLGTNKDNDATIAADDILISFGKTKSNGTYSPGKFIVRADGKYFGELAALNYVNTWDSNSQASYSNENTEPNQNAYAILLGPHSEGSGASQINYIMSVFNSNTQTAQMQRVFDIRDNGTVDLEGVLNARNGVQLTGSLRAYTDSDNNLSYIEINGEDGTIGHSTKSWFIDETGYAEFQNARIRGKLSTIVFEKEKVSMIGGDLVISPTFYIEKEIREDVNEGWDVSNLGFDNYYIPFTGNDNPNQVIFYVATSEENNEFDGQYYFGTIIREGTQEPYSYFLDNSSPSENDEQLINKLYSININPTPYHGSLTEGSNIVLANLGTNVIRLTANQTQGATIKVMGNGLSGAQSQLGWINFNDGSADTGMRQLAQNQYGLYSDNAFLEGKLFLPNAGMTNEEVLPAGLDISENNHVMLESSYTSSEGTFEIASIKLDYTNIFNIIGGLENYVVVKVNNLYYLGIMTYASEKYSFSYISNNEGNEEVLIFYRDLPELYGISLEEQAWGNINNGTIIYSIPDSLNGHFIRIWAGEDPGNKKNAPFIVTHNGSIYALNGYFNGTINSGNAFLGQENGDFLRATTDKEGNSKIEYNIFQLNNTLEELENNIKTYAESYTNNKINNDIQPQLNQQNTDINLLKNQIIPDLKTYLIVPTMAGSNSNMTLKSDGNIVLKITNSDLQIFDTAKNTAITTWKTEGNISSQESNYGVFTQQLRIGNFAFVKMNNNLRLQKVI